MHRLSRRSPFDPSGRRHTSFVSVGVTAAVARKDAAVDIDAKDLRIDRYRSSGPGGQHVNKRDTAVRITHLPSGLVVRCQAERSQGRNKALAMHQLRARLTERAEAERAAQRAAREGRRPAPAWGRQIRSYVPAQGRVTDHRSGAVADVKAVLDGELERLTEAEADKSV